MLDINGTFAAIVVVRVSSVGATCPLEMAGSEGGAMGGELRVQVSEEGADAEWLAVLAGYLRAELVQLHVEDVAPLPAGESPPGARASGIAVVGGLLVSLGQSLEGLQSVVSTISGWLRRGEGSGRRVRLELDGDVLELSQVSADDQERLIGLFVSRHGAGEGGQWAASAKP